MLGSFVGLQAQDSLDVITTNPFETGRPIKVSKQKDVVTDNPFDVNHIPIRKNQRTKSTSETQQNVSVVEEQFAIIVILTLLIMLAVLLSIKRTYIYDVFNAFIRENLLPEFNKNYSNGWLPVSLTGYGFALLSIAFFGTLSFKTYLSTSWWQGFIILILAISGWYAFKHLALYILRLVFSIEDVVKYYTHQIFLTNTLTGVILLPLSIFMAYSNATVSRYLMIIGLCFVIILQVFKSLKVLRTVLPHILGQIVQFFSYLCALEIAPVLLILKYVG